MAACDVQPPIISPDGRHEYINGQWIERQIQAPQYQQIPPEQEQNVNDNQRVWDYLEALYPNNQDFASTNNQEPPIWAVLLVMVILFGGLWLGITLLDEGPQQIQYKVVCSCQSVSITIEGAGGGVEQFSDVQMRNSDGTGKEWIYDFTAELDGYTFLYVSAQNQQSAGKVIVAIYIDGELVEGSSSEGGYVIATASDMR